jgi:tetratricopeptide (TPR) repeat protein
VSAVTRGHTELSRGEYLLTEFRVIITYIRLMFLPVGQNLDYDYPVFRTFLEAGVVVSMLIILLILGSATYVLSKYRETMPHTVLIVFGIYWFFLNLMLESSVIPLNNVIFEHRLYLPSVGLIAAMVAMVYFVMERGKVSAKTVAVICMIIVLVLAGAAYARNRVWKDEVILWQDVAAKSPDKARPHNNLGSVYQLQGLYDRAIGQFKHAIRVDPGFSFAYNNLGTAYKSKGLTDMAIEQYRIAIRIKPDYPDPYNNLGIAYRSKGLIDRAIEQYRIAIRLDPRHIKAHNNLGNAYYSRGFINKAIVHYKKALELSPNLSTAYYNLGVINYQYLKNYKEALVHYSKAIELNPEHAKTFTNRGLVYLKLGNYRKAIDDLNRAVSLDNEDSIAFYNRGRAHTLTGNHEQALKDFNRAERLKDIQDTETKQNGPDREDYL